MNNTNTYLNEIERLKNIFESFKEQVESEKLPCYFAEDRFTKLKKQEKRLKAILKCMNAEDFILEELDELITQTEQFLHDILDIIDIERKQI